MDNNVNYTVTIKDLLSGKLKVMDLEAKQLEGSLATVATTASGMGSKLMSGLGMMGIGFAAFKGFELIHEGVEAVEKLHQAQAQVKAGLESTGYVAGVTAESLDVMAKKFGASTKFSRAEITDLQSLMLTFPAIVKDTFPAATETILNMSTRLGQDTKSSAIQLGKALQDPIRGVTALRRVGVNFNETQTETIKKLVETGQTAKAQTLILSELTTEFGGSAKAAFDADPLAKYNKTMASMKMAMGEMGMAIVEVLQPALMGLANGVKFVAEGIKNVVHWCEENEDIIKALAVGIGVTTVAWGAYLIATNAAAIAMGVATIATNLLSAGLFILENVMTFGIPIAIAAVTAALYYCYEHFGKFRAMLDGTWEALKTIGGMMLNFFKGLGKTIAGAFLMDPTMIKDGVKQMASAFEDAGSKIGESFNKGYSNSMKEFAEEQAKKKEGKKSAIHVANTATGTGAIAAKKEKNGVSGPKIVTVNIHIGSLINEFKINTTNIQESSKAIHDKVVQALTGAVNDSQLIAGQ